MFANAILQDLTPLFCVLGEDDMEVNCGRCGAPNQMGLFSSEMHCHACQARWRRDNSKPKAFAYTAETLAILFGVFFGSGSMLIGLCLLMIVVLVIYAYWSMNSPLVQEESKG
jgi:hypothetical protein